MIGVFFQDFRYALRGLWLSKGFATIAILCLGFGIGLNTTIFSIVDGVLLKPFPYADPDRLVSVMTTNQKAGIGQANVSYLDLKDWKEGTRAFESIAGSQGRSFALSDGAGDPARYVGGAVTWDLFPTLGIAPILGHGFTADDDKPGAPGVLLLSYAVWSTRYQNDPAVIGRSVLINAAPAVIVGVMPPKFEFPNNQKLWMPIVPLVANDPRGQRSIAVFARLKPGVSTEQAAGELTGLTARLAQTYPATNQDWGARVITLRERFIPPDVTTVIWLMMAGVTLVLLIAGSNVANLLLARASVRQREIALRAALGAGRGRIVRQLLVESIALSVASLPLGILLAEIGTRLIAADMPPDQVPYYITWTMDLRSLAYGTAVAIVTAIVFGLAPALQATRGNLHDTLKEGTRGNSVRRSLLRSGLVVAQISLALVALVGALLFVRTFSNLDTYDVGFDVKHLMSMRFFMAGTPYNPPDSRLHRIDDVIARIEAIPGVAAAFASNYVPLSGGGGGGPIAVEGEPEMHGPQAQFTMIAASPHFAKTMGLPVRGRDITDAEGVSHQPVALINEAMAQALLAESRGDRRPLQDRRRAGRARIMVHGGGHGARHEALRHRPGAGRAADAGGDRAVRLSADPQRRRDDSHDRRSARGDIGGPRGDSRVGLQSGDFQREFDRRRPPACRYWQYGLYGWIFGTIGIVGLLLASVGVYGVLSYSVSQRTQEIGVRIALGAGRREVLKLVVSYGLVLAGIGVGVGLVLAPFGTMAAKSLLYRVSPFDPVTFAGVAALLVGVAFVASYVPARRAMRVDPVVALRGE